MKKQEKGVQEISSVSSGNGKTPASSVTTASSSTASLHTTSTGPSGSTTAPTIPSTNPDTSSRELSGQTMGMKHSKSDHSGLSRKDKKDKHKESKSSLGKKFISKSQENLTSEKNEKQLTTVVEAPRPCDSAPLARAEAFNDDKNKENMALRERERNSVFIKPNLVKPKSLSSNIRKASSTQSIDRTSLSSSSLKSTSSKSSNNSAIKRAQSTQNISKDRLMKKRTSAPTDVMAYNAELLANFEREKKVLKVRISELAKVAESRKGEIEKHKYEIKRLKDHLLSSKDKEDVELLKDQNKQLLDRLQELGFPAEQITDSEKMLLKISSSGTAQSHGSNSDIGLQASTSCDSLSMDCSRPKASTNPITIPATQKTSLMEASCSELHMSTSLSASEPGFSLPDLCGTPEHQSLDTTNWDKQSNKSVNSDGAISEASVACLTERILQMEETNYSTTEELQATLQELGDLQDAVNELTEDNTKLTDEKAVLLESLCTQTEKLENARIQLEQLKCLLISGDLPDKSDKDGHLLGLLKSAQEEREELMRKQTEWSNAVQCLEAECREAHDAEEALRESCSFLKDANTSLKAERDAQEKQMWEMKETQTAEQIEVTRLKTLLENEKGKVIELETARLTHDRTDLEALLDTARQDKDRAEQKVADLMESLALSQCEVTRLKECLSSKEQELLVARNNANTQVTDLQFRLETMEKEKLDYEREGELTRKHVDQLESDCNRFKEDKKNAVLKLQEIQTELRGVKQQKQILEAEMQEISSKHDMESEEWKQFQKDLQTAVVIANNFSQETQDSMDKLTNENEELSEQLSSMRGELERLRQENRILQQAKEGTPAIKQSILTNAELKGKVFTTMDKELAVLREGRPHMDQRSQSFSVKTLIRSIEEQVKSGCSSVHSSHSESRRSSASSDISLASLKELVKSPASPLPEPDSPRSPTKELSFRATSFKSKSIEKSPQSRLVVGGPVAPGPVSPEGQGKELRNDAGEPPAGGRVAPQISSILKDRNAPRRSSAIVSNEADVPKKEMPGKDPLTSLAKLMKGSKRNALLKWCQLKTIPYSNIDITNFSSSWNDGLGFCALLHTYVPEKIPYSELTSEEKKRNFTIAFNAGETVGIKATLNINDMASMERPDWQAVMNYVTAIYRHFEVERL